VNGLLHPKRIWVGGVMNALNLQNVKNDFFIPISNLYYDEALKALKATEFKTYISIVYLIKSIGPNTQKYFSTKKDLLKEINSLNSITEKTFLKHLKTFENLGLLKIEGKSFDIGFNITDSKSGGFTSIDILDLEYLILNLDNNELKLYMAIYRLIKGFNKKSSRLTYSLMKKWSAIKNKAIFIAARDGLKNKGLISALLDLNTNSYQYKLREFSNGFVFKTVEKEPRHVGKKQQDGSKTVEKKPHINNIIPKRNKYLKKSISSKENTEQKQSKFIQKNTEKIFKFFDENSKTSHLGQEEKHKLLEALIQNLEEYKGFNGENIKTSADYYLTLEHDRYGRILDKILDRYYFQLEEKAREDKSRKLYFSLFQKHYPEQIKGLKDYESNDLSRYKLDELIKKSPGVGEWNESFLNITEMAPNPNFKKINEVKAQQYMEKLLKQKTSKKEIGIDERLDLIESLLPIVNEKYPVESEYLVIERKKTFKEFIEFTQR
jgi:hypothetical protein